MNNLKIAFLAGIGLKEILIIALIVLLLYGGQKIPELLKGLGTGIKEFKKSVKEEDEPQDQTEQKN